MRAGPAFGTAPLTAVQHAKDSPILIETGTEIGKGSVVTPSPKSDPEQCENPEGRDGLKGFEMKKRHSAEQIVGMLRQADVELDKGRPSGPGDRCTIAAGCLDSSTGHCCRGSGGWLG